MSRRGWRRRLEGWARPRGPEALPVRFDRRRVYVLPTAFGLFFSAWLTYLELWVIDAICQWCVVSAILATIIFLLAWLDLRDTTRLQEEMALGAADELREGAFGDSIRNTAEVSARALRGD